MGTRKRILDFIEALAYPIALWDIMVLFFEPVIGNYLYIGLTQFWTAVANLAFLVLTLLIRLINFPVRENRNILITDGVLLGFGSILLLYDAKFVIFFLLIRQTFFISRYLLFRVYEGALGKRLLANPPMTFMLSFAATILTGTFLLMLPSATTAHKMTSFINALFTATSATCVTGLIVVDTGSYYSLFGQLVILALIQVGGLGIMTISTAFAVLLGQRLTLKVENVMQNVMGETLSQDMVTLVKNVVVFTFVIELAGATLLFFTFSQSYTPLKAIYLSVFHAVSAFCNAGFSLFRNNLTDYAFNFNISITVSLLIICGGLGFPVITDLYNQFFGSKKRYTLTLHTKVVLSMTAFLLVFGTVAFFIAEYDKTMKGFSLPYRVLCSWFQSVTCRTSGFNTIDQGQLSHSSILVSLILMFIGASPGSTGGGVKTSTFSLLLLSVLSLIKGQTEITIFRRKINQNNVRLATALIIVSLIFISLIVYLILLIEPFTLESTVFESVSAFGTVGLSMGITSFLSSMSKFLIVVLMYVGRVGPLTLLFALSQRRKPQHFTLPEERIAIG
ncbi:MAG TPA: TrkH family potassium uptake protein [Candidatus Cloacimonadota bacterium]|nr:TrkH family potassium uptake protein [Candidatus Cloacimonadota bacterium]HOV17349.1 TrkH family potassium uptake protein [Candidatus Cloacimonadota bacterium]HQL15034.1 TrkH family potassium uptake protein [Candidatus Cloacimonadota bacterium]